MDREQVLMIFVAVFCGGALLAAGWWPAEPSDAGSALWLERRAWRRLWQPLVPAALVLAVLCGWALAEPEPAEPVPWMMIGGAVPFALILLRAAWRAARSALRADAEVVIGTVGLLRPRVVVAPRVAQSFDAAALAAAVAHERAHARHCDPLRLWLAQLASDVCFPWPQARLRFDCWRRALELARDEEARRSGITGPDLAAAILAALRLQQAAASASAVSLTGDAALVTERIARLVRPLEPATPQRPSRLRWWYLALAIVAALVLGTQFGEHVVQQLLVAG